MNDGIKYVITDKDWDKTFDEVSCYLGIWHSSLVYSPSSVWPLDIKLTVKVVINFFETSIQ